MEPSTGIIETVETAKKNDLETFQKWADLFQKIPLFIETNAWTTLGNSIRGFADGTDDNEDYMFKFHFHIDQIKKNFTGVRFLPDYKAEIDSSSYIGQNPEALEKRNLFGFTGTWEEVVRKIVEISNLIMAPAPPLRIQLIESEKQTHY